MNILVIGRGVAALGFLEQLLSSQALSGPETRIVWIRGSKNLMSCSVNSTALVALQGIQTNVSPLGDLLNKGFYAASEFFENRKPDGVSLVKRLHVDRQDNLERRFSHLMEIKNNSFLGHDLGLSAVEMAYSIHPKTFLSWWESEITQEAKLKGVKLSIVDDLITEIEEERAVGISADYLFDYCIDGSGALGLKLGLRNEGTLAVGHYLVFNNVEFTESTIKDSFVLTHHGKNFIYQRDYRAVIFGGTNEEDEVLCPKLRELKDSFDHFKEHYPYLSFTGKKKVLSGPRHKGLRRMPKVFRNKRVFHLIGLYKNGYSICHDMGKEVVAQICEEISLV